MSVQTPDVRRLQLAARMHCANNFEAALRFGAWCGRQGKKLTVDRIQHRLECSKSTAYRYMRAYRDACDPEEGCA